MVERGTGARVLCHRHLRRVGNSHFRARVSDHRDWSWIAFDPVRQVCAFTTSLMPQALEKTHPTAPSTQRSAFSRPAAQLAILTGEQPAPSGSLGGRLEGSGILKSLYPCALGSTKSAAASRTAQYCPISETARQVLETLWRMGRGARKEWVWIQSPQAWRRRSWGCHEAEERESSRSGVPEKS